MRNGGLLRMVVRALVCGAAVVHSLAQAPPQAAPDRAWQQLQALTSKDTVKLFLRGGETRQGQVRSWTSGSLTVRDLDGRQQQIDRGAVVRVTRKSRGRGALWGAIAGFAVGFPVGAAAGPYVVDYGNPPAATRLRHGAGWGLFFSGIGAGIGALRGLERTVY